MIRALWISGGVVLIAFLAMLRAPPGQADPIGTLLRTAAATALLVFLGRLAGTADHRRPPNPAATRVVTMILVTVAIGVIALRFSPNWSIALGVWYLTLFATGALLNRWCEAPERYAVLVATFSVVMISLILMALSAASPRAETDVGGNVVLFALWRNLGRVVGHPGDAAWTWLAWRLADRLRPPEARRPKAASVRAARGVQAKRR